MGYEQAGRNASEAFRCDEGTGNGLEAEGIDREGHWFGVRLVFEERS